MTSKQKDDDDMDVTLILHCSSDFGSYVSFLTPTGD